MCVCVYLGVCIIHEVKYVHISLVSTGVHAVSAYVFVSVAPWEGALYLYGTYRSIYFKKTHKFYHLFSFFYAHPKKVKKNTRSCLGSRMVYFFIQPLVYSFRSCTLEKKCIH